MNIGIDSDQHLLYEGRSFVGAAIWPSPFVSTAKIVSADTEKLVAPEKQALIGDEWMFREDSFDPIARIRRGRFYRAGDRQPVEWSVHAHPALPTEVSKASGDLLTKRLTTFHSNSMRHLVTGTSGKFPLVLLGIDDRFTVWTIISIETISTGEDLVALKSRSSFGILPDVDFGLIVEPYKDNLRNQLEGFADAVHRSAATSIIDRARDCASLILLAYYNATSKNAKDLGALTKKLDAEGKTIAASVARILARLHARAKPVEVVKRALRPIHEQDGELAIQCLGTLLCELGWAKWR
jgi:hypothetical protein